MRNILNKSAIICVLTLSSLSIKAQEGFLDNSFGTNGVLTIPLTGNNFLSTIVVQPDGYLLVGGQIDPGSNSQIYINRLLPNGNNDGSFNGGSAKTFQLTAAQFNVADFIALENNGNIFYSGYTGNQGKVYLGKLNSNGTSLIAPYVSPLVSGSNSDLVSGMSYNTSTKTIAICAFDFNTLAYMMAFKFSNNCNPDSSFNGKGNIYLNTPTPALLSANGIANLDNGSIIMGGTSDSAGTSRYTVIKLKKDGTFDPNFGSNNSGIKQIISPIVNGTVKATKVLTNGKILLLGTNSGSTALGLARLNADGTVDNNFNQVSYSYPSATQTLPYSLTVQPDNKIIVSGAIKLVSGIKYGFVMRYNADGTIDNSFGPTSNGLLLFTVSSEIFSSDLDVKNGNAYFVGKSGASLMVARVKYDTPSWNILGKDIVSISSQNIYSVAPYSTGYSYTWSYSNPNDLIFPYQSISSTTDSIAYNFGPQTSSTGTITCTISGGGITRTITKNIIINQVTSRGTEITPTQCPIAQTKCTTTYIDNFKINDTLLSTNTNCSATGYTDYTSAKTYTTLYKGDKYQAVFGYNAPFTSLAYAGIWIDFDNNGKINETKEYVGSSFSQTGTMVINNIVIPDDVEKGPKRIRVILGAKELNYNSFCPANNVSGETEDYMVIVNEHELVEGPNFITPNGDGKNDFFVVHGIETAVDNHLIVFNQVGDKIYEASNYKNDWAGTDNSGNVVNGTYYYSFTKDPNNDQKRIIVKGFFEIRK